MSLPDHIRPTERVIAPTRIAPGYDLEPAPAAPLHLPPGAEVRIVGYQPYADGFIPIKEVVHHTERTPERDLTPQPLLDPAAQRMLAGGIGAGAAGAGIGWGVAQVLGALTGLSAGTVFALALLLAAAKWSGRARTTHLTVHQTAGMFGRNHHTTTRR